jgi:hypothetical protein
MKIKVSVEAGKTSTIRRSMEPLEREAKGPFGELVTQGFGNSAVYLNDAYYANANEISSDSKALLLKPGKYRLKIKTADGETIRDETVTINGEETLILSRTAAPIRRR